LVVKEIFLKVMVNMQYKQQLFIAEHELDTISDERVLHLLRGENYLKGRNITKCEFNRKQKMFNIITSSN
jgi:hypothetical protein